LSVIDNIKCIADRLTGRFHVPPGLLHSGEVKILHISDTPTTLYPAIESLLRTLKPGVLVHTGDLADDIKLELEPGNIGVYRRAVIPFLHMLEESPAGEIYVVPGNHDSMEVIDEHAGRTRVVSEGEVLFIQGMYLGLAHNAKKLPRISGYSLYGHNYSRGPQGPAVNLNGLKNVNVILCHSGRVVKISYPLTTNYDRKMHNCYGIPGTV